MRLLRQVEKALIDASVIYEVMDCDPELADTAAFCEAYGFKPEDSANTIIVMSKKVEPAVYCVCVVLATDRLDVNSAVRKLMSVKKTSFADSETTKKLSGMEIGGVTAPGIPDLPIYIDENVMKREKVVMGGGNRTSKIILNPEELEKLPNVTVTSISKTM